MRGRDRVACCADCGTVATIGGAPPARALSAACRTRLLLAALALALAATGHASAQPSTPTALTQQALQAAASGPDGLPSAVRTNLTLSGDPQVSMTLQLPIEGRVVTLDLTPQAIVSDDYKLIAQVVEGGELRLVEYPSQRPTTLRGNVREIDGAAAAITLTGQGLYGAVMLADATLYWIEPSSHGPNRTAGNEHLIYRDADLPPDIRYCGEPASTNPRVAAQSKLPPDQPDPTPQTPCVGPCTTEVAFDADVEYFNTYGSVPAVEFRIISILNVVNLQYNVQVGITHVITQIVVRTAEPDPYTSNDAAILLTQFRRDWLNNHAHVRRDVTQLFTGRTMGGNVVGLAWAFGGICTPFGYSFVWSDCCGSLACATNLTAHELGHSWGADHCNCPTHTMHAMNSCANQFHPTLTIPEIIAYRDSRTCLNEGSPPPANDLCNNAIFVTEGAYPFSSFNAETDGPEEPDACNFYDYNQIGGDVWFCYTASCSGAATVSLCGSTFDTKLAVYEGCFCPSDAAAIACNDDYCGGPARQSQVVFTADEGGRYLIRAGGFEGWTGNGLLSIGCAPGAPVCGDGNIEPPEECDPPDGVTCDLNCRLTNVEHNCCFVGHGTGCSDPEIEACVCSQDQYCCLVAWDSICVDEVEGIGCSTCSDPANDACANATPVAEGIYPFDTKGAVTDGPAEPALCTFDDYSQIGADIWYCYTPSCTGQAIFSLCDSAFDTKMAIYDSCTCPTAAQAVACNDDACGPGPARQSMLFVPVTEGVSKLVRIGGYDAATGNGAFSVTCIECYDRAQCDDTRYCTGQELCVGGLCHQGLEPCTTGQWCDDDDDMCFDYGDGDFDGDDDVDLRDFGFFQGCFGLASDPDCEAANMTGSPVVNLQDFDMFWQNMSAPDNTAGQ